MKLTELQKVILLELIAGSTNIQIAESIGYSERSLRRKIKNLYTVFKVAGRNELIREVTIAKARGLL